MLDLSQILPEETLAYIFGIAQAIDPPRGPVSFPVHPNPLHGLSLGWIRVSHVDRRWRQIAVDEATLWSRLTDVIGTRWLGEMLHRSKAAPLSVYEKDFMISSSAILQTTMSILLPTHHSRFKHLDFSLSAIRRSGMQDLMSLSFDSLEYLHLRSSVSDFDIFRDSEPLNLFAIPPPRLRHLNLNLPVISSTGLDWTSSIYDNLTTLQLAVRTGLFLPQFLAALDRMKVLQFLTLSTRYTRDVEPLVCDYRCSMTPQDVIHMGSMRCLTFGTSIECVAHFLRHVRLPNTAELSIPSPLPNPSTPSKDQAYQMLRLGMLAVWETNLHSNPLRTASMTSIPNPYYFEIRLALTRSSAPWDAHYKTMQAPELFLFQSCKISLNLVQRISLPVEQLASPLTHLPLEDIRHLILHDGYHLSMEWIAPFLAVEVLDFLPKDAGIGQKSENDVPHKKIKLLESESNALCQPSLLTKLRYIDLPSYNLHSILELWGSDGVADVCRRFPAFENAYDARLEMGSPPLTFCLHIAEEVISVRDGRFHETSCTSLEKRVVSGSVETLAKLRGVMIVPKQWNVHTGMPVSTKVYDSGARRELRSVYVD